LTPCAQPEEGVTYASRIDKAEARIDWTHEALAIERRVRAFNPVPVAETLLAGEQLRIFSAAALDEYDSENAPKSADPGTIIAILGGSMVVQCGRGRLAVTEVQRPGRRPVAVRELSHSFPLEGRRLG
jgi:methionyl-tRNA formyltransferase